MGKQRIVISERDNIAVLFDDDVAVEFVIHRGDVLLGDVYLAQVENILPSIDAAFVNVGTDRMGFLHSSDVQGRGDLKNRLQPKQNIVVQVMKEPTGHKGPRVTTNLALPGRFLVLMPESRGISISRKIAEQKERARLKSIVSLMKPPGVGVILRTEAESQADPEIQEDFETLIERWQNIVAMADTAKPPTLLYRDQDLLYRVIREIVTEDVKEIVVDTQFGQQRATQLLQNWGIEHPVKVTQYNGTQNIIVGMGIDKEIKQALQTKVPLPSGGYLYIQPTEALTVIDVNSGKFTSLQSQAETIRLTNLEAAKEIARQLRLRNIGGMIIVDFIDMESRANQLSILENFENELSIDKAKPQIGQLSDLGLVEMTRHRQGQSLSEIFTKKCMGCAGSGLTMDDILWAPGGDGRQAMGRHKLPIRQQRGQGGPQQRQPLPKPGAPSLRKLMDPRSGHQPLREGFLQQSKAVQAEQEKAVTENMTLEELYKHRTVKQMGLRMASGIKFAKLPIGINAILIRMNPKANDIFTLVDAIEGASYMSPDLDSDMDDLSEDLDTFPPAEAAQNGQRRRSFPEEAGLAFQERLPLEAEVVETLADEAEEPALASPQFDEAVSALLPEGVDVLEDDAEDTDDSFVGTNASEPSDAETASAESGRKSAVATVHRRRGRPPAKPAEKSGDGEEKPRRGRPPKKPADE